MIDLSKIIDGLNFFLTYLFDDNVQAGESSRVCGIIYAVDGVYNFKDANGVTHYNIPGSLRAGSGSDLECHGTYGDYYFYAFKDASEATGPFSLEFAPQSTVTYFNAQNNNKIVINFPAMAEYGPDFTFTSIGFFSAGAIPTFRADQYIGGQQSMLGLNNPSRDMVIHNTNNTYNPSVCFPLRIGLDPESTYTYDQVIDQIIQDCSEQGVDISPEDLLSENEIIGVTESTEPPTDIDGVTIIYATEINATDINATEINAGDINLSAGDINISGNADVSGNADISGGVVIGGAAGAVVDMDVSGGVIIGGAAGAVADVDINADVNLHGDANFSGGDININAGDITINNGGGSSTQEDPTEPGGGSSGTPGDINITGGGINIDGGDNSQIIIQSSGSSGSEDININVLATIDYDEVMSPSELVDVLTLETYTIETVSDLPTMSMPDLPALALPTQIAYIPKFWSAGANVIDQVGLTPLYAPLVILGVIIHTLRGHR